MGNQHSTTRVHIEGSEGRKGGAVRDLGMT